MNISAVLQKFYAIKALEITPMEGYDGTNYRVRSHSATYVLKRYILNPDSLAFLTSENHILARLGRLDTYEFPKTFPNTKGDELTIADDQIVRLLSYVEGDFLGGVPHSPEILTSFGAFLGHMDRELLGCHDPILAAREYRWDLRHLDRNRTYLSCIREPRDRSLADYFMLQFEQQVLPVQERLRKSVVHNDANVWNVLTADAHITGIIDFGDMCYTWLISELAVGLTYLMMDKEDPLEIAGVVTAAYHGAIPLEEAELEVLYYLVAGRLCISVCNSAYAKTLDSGSDYITISERGAWDLLRRWLRINPVKALAVFREAAGFEPAPSRKLGDQVVRRNRFLSDAQKLTYDRPIQMSRSAFQYMYDEEGHTFLDAYNNIMLAGHCHPAVVRAGQKMMARLNTNTRYIYEELAGYSEKLLEKFPEPLTKVFHVNSGSAASDLAIRLAMAYTGKNRIMVLEHGYHGHTIMGRDISHYKYSREGGKKDHIIQLPLPKAFNSGFGEERLAAAHYANETLQSAEGYRGDLAAFIAEPVVGCAGQVPLALGYLKAIYPGIRKAGGVCISDEVQVGFGRLGDYFWGFEMHEVVPDIVIIGKPMGNGHPMGAVITTAAVAKSFEEGPEFFSSFGGNPVSCAIGQAVLGVIEAEGLQEHARETGNYLVSLLKELQLQFPRIADVRGSGLFLGIELLDAVGRPDTALAAKVKNGLRDRCILVGTDGPFDNVLKIKPPLSFTIEDSTKLATAMWEIFKDS